MNQNDTSKAETIETKGKADTAWVVKPFEDHYGMLRESDLEKTMRDDFREYEEWRRAQAAAVPQDSAGTKAEEKPAKKKGGFTRWDFIFIGLGLLFGVLYQSCKAAR